MIDMTNSGGGRLSNTLDELRISGINCSQGTLEVGGWMFDV